VLLAPLACTDAATDVRASDLFVSRRVVSGPSEWRLALSLCPALELQFIADRPTGPMVSAPFSHVRLEFGKTEMGAERAHSAKAFRDQVTTIGKVYRVERSEVALARIIRSQPEQPKEDAARVPGLKWAAEEGPKAPPNYRAVPGSIKLTSSAAEVAMILTRQLLVDPFARRSALVA
jgi:hypothetical protein